MSIYEIVKESITAQLEKIAHNTHDLGIAKKKLQVVPVTTNHNNSVKLMSKSEFEDMFIGDTAKIKKLQNIVDVLDKPLTKKDIAGSSFYKFDNMTFISYIFSDKNKRLIVAEFKIDTVRPTSILIKEIKSTTIDFNTMKCWSYDTITEKVSIPTVNQPIDMDIEESIVLKALINAKCFAISDFVRELTPYGDVPKINLTWSELLQAPSLNDIKKSKWKRIAKLQINHGKLDLIQLIAIKNVRPYITWEYTYRIIDLMRQKKVKASINPFILMNRVIKAQTGKSDRYTVSDTMKPAKELKIRLDYKGKSFKSFRQLHDDINVKYRNKLIKQKYENDAELKQYDKFKPIIEAVQLDNRFEHLNTVYRLIKEGVEMHHCVATYIDQINRGYALILAGVINHERVTIEINRHDYHRDNGFSVNQVQLARNMKPQNETINQVLEFVSNINRAFNFDDVTKVESNFHGNGQQDYFAF